MIEPCDLSATEARAMIRSKELSPVELLESCLSRTDHTNSALNAVITRVDEMAMDDARRKEQEVIDGAPLGPLHGLPVAIKDLQPTSGILTTYGSEYFADHIPVADSGIVRRVRTNGGVITGKTNIPEMSIGANTVNRLFGATGNPFDPTKTCGGSSGGSAVAVAVGMAALATGSDHGGSLRIPACYSGVVGHRSSPGLVPHELRTITQTNYSLQGPIGRTVADTALLLAALAQRDNSSRLDPMCFPLDSSIYCNLAGVDIGNLRVGVSTDLGGVLVSKSIRESFKERVSFLSKHVAVLSEVDVDLTDAPAVDWQLRADVFATQYHREIDNYDGGINPNIRNTYETALSTDVLAIAKARRRQMELFQEFNTQFENFDLIICPGVSVPPFKWTSLYPEEVDGRAVENYMAWLALSSALTVVGNPVTALPCGYDLNGTPFGIQCVGPMFGDHALLSNAAAIEQLFSVEELTARPIPDVAWLKDQISECATTGKEVVG
ncbi:MAG: amidase [Actinomycetota bacterium]|nr:amidase [Actinomycetota bacterium]MDG2120016.1 amidase [Actinomycetota bacterium]